MNSVDYRNRISYRWYEAKKPLLNHISARYTISTFGVGVASSSRRDKTNDSDGEL